MPPLDGKAEDGGDVQGRVEEDHPHRDLERRLEVLLRLEPRRERLLRAEESEPERIARDGARNAHDGHLVEPPAVVDEARQLGGEDDEADGGGHDDEEHVAH